MRTLSQIPSGSRVFIDANIFIYHFGGDGNISDACTEFLLRVEEKDIVMTLEKYSIAPEKIRRMNVAILAVTLQDFLGSKGIRDSYGLLTNDSTSVSIMKRFGIADIATNDSDFERVNGLRVWKPLA